MMEKQRIFGLDFLRVTAISLVLFAQTIWLLPQGNSLLSQAAGVFHFIGLEIFFMLSGFLLGLKLYPLYLQKSFGKQTVILFVKRRLFQILPVYFLCLLANITIAVYSGYEIDGLWKYFLAIRNFATPMPAFFSESWGITILLWISVLFPVVLLLLDRIRKPADRQLFFAITVLLLIVASLFLKLSYSAATGNADINSWDTYLRSVAIYRFDAVLIGIMAAWLLSNYPVFFRRARMVFAAAGILGLAFLFAGVGYLGLTIDSYALFWNVLYLPLTSLIIASFLPMLFLWRAVFLNLKKRMAFVAQLTYAVYLLHFGIVLQLLREIFPTYAAGPGTIWVFIIAWLLLTFTVAVLIYQFFIRKLNRTPKG